MPKRTMNFPVLAHTTEGTHGSPELLSENDSLSHARCGTLLQRIRIQSLQIQSPKVQNPETPNPRTQSPRIQNPKVQNLRTQSQGQNPTAPTADPNLIRSCSALRRLYRRPGEDRFIITLVSMDYAPSKSATVTLASPASRLQNSMPAILP